MNSPGFFLLQRLKRGQTLYFTFKTKPSAVGQWLNVYIPQGDTIVPVIVHEHPDCRPDELSHDLGGYTWYYQPIAAGKGKTHALVEQLGELVHGDEKYFLSESL